VKSFLKKRSSTKLQESCFQLSGMQETPCVIHVIMIALLRSPPAICSSSVALRYERWRKFYVGLRQITWHACRIGQSPQHRWLFFSFFGYDKILQHLFEKSAVPQNRLHVLARVGGRGVQLHQRRHAGRSGAAHPRAIISLLDRNRNCAPSLSERQSHLVHSKCIGIWN